MDYQTVLNGVESWPIDDQIRFVPEVWERIGERGHELDLIDALKAELDRRLAAHRANPEAAIPREQVEAEALARLRR